MAVRVNTLPKHRRVGHNLQSAKLLALAIVAKHNTVTRRCLYMATDSLSRGKGMKDVVRQLMNCPF